MIVHLLSSNGLYGAEKMVVALANAQRRAGYDSRVLLFANTHSQADDVVAWVQQAGVPLGLLKCRGQIDPRAVAHLRQQFQRDRPSVVHVHGYKENLYGYLATRGLDTVLVGTCHRFDQGRRNTFDKATYSRMAGVAAVSPEAATQLHDVYQIPHDRIRFIANGIDIPPLHPQPMATPATIALVGRLAPEKAPLDFIKMATKLGASYRYVVAGDGPLRPDMAAAAAQAGVDVDFRGFCDDMAALYSSIDVLVQPSLREGMPLTALEAMAAGVPVVATRVGALPDLISSPDMGRLVATHDIAGMAQAVADLTSSDTTYRQVQETAYQEVATNYSATRMAEQYDQFYGEIGGGGGIRTLEGI